MIIRALLIIMIVVAGAWSTTALSKPPKALQKIEKSVDKTDALQNAIFDVLMAYDADFEPVLGEAIDEERRQKLMDDTLAFDAFAQGKSRMERLREAEMIADSARTLLVEVPDANGYYWQNTVITEHGQSEGKYVTWNFDVPYAEREAFASNLFNRISPMFARDKKWTQSIVDNKQWNPVVAQRMYFYTLGSGGKHMLFVTVEYAHEEQTYRPFGGVVLRVYTFRMG